MLAALLHEPGRIEIGEVAEPEVGPDEVRVSVGGVGLCGSDMSVFSGKWQAPQGPETRAVDPWMFSSSGAVTARLWSEVTSCFLSR